MIKIDKSLLPNAIPVSIRPPHEDFFENGKINVIARHTNKKRLQLIDKGGYIDTDHFNNRYKYEDTKSALKAIYKNKCAFCEQRVEQFHVEHYRPKTIYYWLAFSWDNLLSACHTCNQEKGVKFQLQGVAGTFQNTAENLKNINTLSSQLDAQELPELINPEITDPDGLLEFDKLGVISSSEARMSYTITTCKIDRKYLNDRRRGIWNALAEKLKTELMEASTKQQAKQAIDTVVRGFKADYENEFSEYRAFRKYVLDNWIKAEIKQILS